MSKYKSERVSERNRMKDEQIQAWLNSLSEEDIVKNAMFFDAKPHTKPKKKGRSTGTGRKWTQEQKDLQSEVQRIRWALTTEEEREEFRKAMRRIEWTPERRAKHGEIMKNSLAKLTPEQLSERSRKGNETRRRMKQSKEQ